MADCLGLWKSLRLNRMPIRPSPFFGRDSVNFFVKPLRQTLSRRNFIQDGSPSCNIISLANNQLQTSNSPPSSLNAISALRLPTVHRHSLISTPVQTRTDAAPISRF